MTFSPEHYSFTLFLRAAAVSAIVFGCLNFTVSAQDKRFDERRHIVQIENDADALKNVWNESAARRSSELYLEAAQLWKANKNFAKAAACLRQAVKLKTMLGEEKSVAALLLQALDLEKKAENIGGEAETLGLLTRVFTKLENKSASEFYHRQALKKVEKAAQPAASASVFYSSAYFFLYRQNYPEMKKQLAKSAELYRAIGDRDGESEVLTELAYSSIIANNRIEGRDFARAALSIAKASNNRRNRTFALIALGDALQRMGEWEQAIKIFDEAEKLFPENLDYYEKAILINRIGFYHLAFGDLNTAKKYFQKSLSLFVKIGKSEGSSELLSILGQISSEQKNYAEAMEYFGQSRRIAEKSNDFLSLATLDLKIGESFYYLENFAESEKYFVRSLNYYNRIGLDFRIAETQEKLGLVFEKQGKLKKAEEKYLLALGINKKVLSKFAQAQNHYNLARIGNLQNERAAAFENIELSIELTESAHGETANSQLKRSFFSQIYERYELYINLLMKMREQSSGENYAVAALRAAEKSRARSMLENLSLSESGFIKDADADGIKREQEIRAALNAKADKLTDLLSRNAEKNVIDQIGSEIAELEHELEEIKAELKQKSPIYSAIKNPAPFDVAEFQRNILDDKSLLLEFSFGAEQSYLWLVSRTAVRAYVLPPRAQIESRIERLRELIAAPEMKTDESIEDYWRRVKTAENDYKIESKQLSRELFGQVSGELAGKRLIVVPDGKLHYFPIAALPLPDSAGDEPFLLANEIVYEPSAETLALLMRNSKNAVSASKNLLVFSDPIFSVQDSRVATIAANVEAQTESPAAGTFRFADSLTSLARLNATGNEADAILEIVGASGSTTLSGAAATREKALDAAISEYKIIHFATHGLINEERPALSGIVLSQVDENGQPRDGVVRLQDIYAMNLSADAVVLSACSTGVGKEVKGEGLMSLNNAFLQIGAKSVVASLWKVDDSAAQELMKNFYRELSAGTATTSQALRLAQIRLRQNGQYQSPFHWAAFTVQGDFVTAPQISAKFDYRIFAWLIFPLVALGIYFYRRRSVYSTAK